MKKQLLALCMAVTMVMLACLPAFAANAVDGKGEAIYGIPTIDGIADDIWLNATEYDCNLVYDESEGTGADGKVRLMWSEDFFYAFVTVDDKTPFHNSETPYYNDCVEICVDLDNSKDDFFDDIDDSQIRIQSTGAIDGLYGELYYEEDIIFAVGYVNGTDLSGGYSIEVAVPAKGYMEAGKIVGFDVQIVDDETGEGVSSQKGFYDTSDNIWQNPSLLGEITLLAPVVVTPEPTAEPTAEPVAVPTAEPVVDEPTAEPVVDTPTADPKAEITPEAPVGDPADTMTTGPSKTGDPAAMTLLVTAVLAAASAAITKKRG